MAKKEMFTISKPTHIFIRTMSKNQKAHIASITQSLRLNLRNKQKIVKFLKLPIKILVYSLVTWESMLNLLEKRVSSYQATQVKSIAKTKLSFISACKKQINYYVKMAH